MGDTTGTNGERSQLQGMPIVSSPGSPPSLLLYTCMIVYTEIILKCLDGESLGGFSHVTGSVSSYLLYSYSLARYTVCTHD